MRAIVNWFMLVAVPCLAAAVPAVGQDKKPEAIAPADLQRHLRQLSANAVKAGGDPLQPGSQRTPRPSPWTTNCCVTGPRVS